MSPGEQLSILARVMAILRSFFVSNEEGQASVEYGVIAAALLLGFVFAGRPMWIALVQAMQVYFDSFYFLIRLPIP